MKAISGYSAHADQPQLLEWASLIRFNARTVFVVQGEEEASAALARRLIDDLAINAVIPEENQEVIL